MGWCTEGSNHQPTRSSFQETLKKQPSNSKAWGSVKTLGLAVCHLGVVDLLKNELRVPMSARTSSKHEDLYDFRGEEAGEEVTFADHAGGGGENGGDHGGLWNTAGGRLPKRSGGSSSRRIVSNRIDQLRTQELLESSTEKGFVRFKR